jgi:hypothetical protein
MAVVGSAHGHPVMRMINRRAEQRLSIVAARHAAPSALIR